MKNYNCMTCQEPMKISIFFHTYIRQHGPQKQCCVMCGAVHEIDGKNYVRLSIPGAQMARLSQEYAYPEYKPFRTGPYRVRYSNGQWAKVMAMFDGDVFRNGPLLFQAGSIMAWQGLAGDMEHLKRMPYDLVPPLPYDGGDDETGL